MTIKEFFYECVNELNFDGDGEFEALCLFEDLLNLSKSQILCSNKKVTCEQFGIIEPAIWRRKEGEPLQYILGKWDFYDLTFKVGEGVLIPRPETEMLVDFALDKLKGIDCPVVFDLCAGTGCVGLTIAKHLNKSQTFLFEKEDAAFKYLGANKDNLNVQKTLCLKADIFEYDLSHLPQCDMLVSNPPYICSNEIQDLQTEVLKEPHTALDGGSDGLDFYRCIAERWTPLVKKGGYIALECGDGQSQDIIKIFEGKFSENKVLFDFNNIDRIVIFRI